MTNRHPEDLLRGLYAGIRSERPFRAFLIALAEHLGAESATIVIERKVLDHPGAVFTGHAPDSRRDAYTQVFDADPFHDLPRGRAVTMREHLGPERFASLPFMADFMRDMGLQNVLGIDVTEPGGTRVRLRCSRRWGDPDFDSGDKALFEWLTPHLAEATGLFLQLDAAQTGERLYATALSRLAIGAAVVDQSGHILSITDQAQTILRRHGLLCRSDTGWRLAPGQDQRLELAKAVRHMASGEVRPDSPVWPIRFEGEEGGILNLLLRRAEASHRLDRPLEGAALLTIADLTIPLAPSAATLARLFGLTPAEAELTVLFGQGLDLDQASALLRISKNTAKAHLRMVFAKTGVTRQSSLVRLVLRSVDELFPCPRRIGSTPDDIQRQAS